MSLVGKTAAPTSHAKSAWRQAVAPYEGPDLRKSVWQIANSFGPYVLLWWAMIASLSVSYWLTLALALPAAGFLVRIFIIAHDCGHHSFFRSRKANNVVGSIGSTLAFTPYGSWRHQHAVHHASAGDLDHRDLGDIWTLTVREYRSSPFWKRVRYRTYRNPLIMFTVGPLIQFLIANRFHRKDATPTERKSIARTNVALLLILVIAAFTIGIKAYLMVQLPIMLFAGTFGVWLFYLQHQFDGVYWDRNEQWDYVREALEGSSFYKLPKVLQWFSGNIGFHHVHHLSPRIPNYNLETCHNQEPIFHEVKRLTLRTALHSLRWRLWDEDRRRLVGFGDCGA